MAGNPSDVEFVIGGEFFRIIRQVTYQMANVRRESMVEKGWTIDVDDFLRGLVKSIPRSIEPHDRIRILVGDNSSDLAESQVDSPKLGEYVRNSPRDICELWPTLLAATWELLGPLEARYRTGFDEDEITSALTLFTRAVEDALRS